MEDLSLHILDVAENSVRADATSVSIAVVRDEVEETLVISITDNGRGLTEEEKRKVLDPFFTRRTERRVGLGLPLLSQAAEACGGGVDIDSTPGRGTTVAARFCAGHIDIQPLGDLAGTVMTLISGYPEVDLTFRYAAGDREFIFESREVRERLGDVSIQDPAVLSFIRDSIAEGIEDVERRP